MTTYVFEEIDFERLREIGMRLFDANPITGDQRRDLANRMQVILAKALRLEGEKGAGCIKR